MTAPEIPRPIWPRDSRRAWNRDPYRRRPKTLGTCFFTIPGPLSSTTTRNSSLSTLLTSTRTSGRTSASSHASRLFSTPSLTAVRRAFVGESYPRICLFRSKNSETLISRCFFASSSAMEVEGMQSRGRNQEGGPGSHPVAPHVWECHLRFPDGAFAGDSMERERMKRRPGGGRKCSMADASRLENRAALRALLVVFADVGTAVRARVGGGLRGLLRRFRLRLPGWLLLGTRFLFGDLERLAELPRPELPRAGRVPPQEEDQVVENEREEHGRPGEVQDEAVERPPRRRERPEVDVRDRPVQRGRDVVRHSETVHIDRISQALLGLVPGAVPRVSRRIPRARRHLDRRLLDERDSRDDREVQPDRVVVGSGVDGRRQFHSERERRRRIGAIRGHGPVG